MGRWWRSSHRGWHRGGAEEKDSGHGGSRLRLGKCRVQGGVGWAELRNGQQPYTSAEEFPFASTTQGGKEYVFFSLFCVVESLV